MNEPARLSAICDHCGLPLPRPLWGAHGAADAGGSNFCCLGCRIASAIQAERSDSGAPQTTQMRLVLGLFFSMSVMVFTFALWSYDVYGVDAGHPAAATFVALLRYLALLFSVPVLVLLGGPIADGAWCSLRSGRLTADLLLILGVLAACGYSLVSVVRGAGDVYFETACMILVFVTLGRWLEAAGRQQASAALDRLARLIPGTVHAIENGAVVERPTDTVRAGDQLEIRPGERIPADGIIQSGATSIDERLFTGESWPAEKGVPDAVLGGTLNIDGCLRLRVTAAPHAGTLHRMLAAVRAARLEKGAAQRFADRMSQWFFPFIGLVAAMSFGWRAATGDVGSGLLSALAVVLIACPCALGIATPLAVWVALGRAAERAVLFRSGAALERLANVRAVCFDKTGTLTSGDVTVSRIVAESPDVREEMLARGAALASRTNHPLGRAIAGVAESAVATSPAPDGVSAVAGRGVESRWPGEPGRTQLGSFRYLVAEAGCEVPPSLAAEIDAARENGDPLTLIGWADRVRGLFVFREELRPESTSALAALQSAGIDCRVLTGDHAGRGRSLQQMLNVPVQAELLPADKVEAVRRASREIGPTAMVGDGVNDAQAMAAADVGIAMGCGADLTRDTADVCLLSNDLSRLPWAIDLSRETVRTVGRNIWWAFGYNSAGVVLAAAGWLHPSVAAVLMVVSSLAVTANSLRLGKSFADPLVEAPNPNHQSDSDFGFRISDSRSEAVR